eukprot:3758833-Alexandrium_andersonii.AAC.1
MHDVDWKSAGPLMLTRGAVKARHEGQHTRTFESRARGEPRLIRECGDAVKWRVRAVSERCKVPPGRLPEAGSGIGEQLQG